MTPSRRSAPLPLLFAALAVSLATLAAAPRAAAAAGSRDAAWQAVETFRRNLEQSSPFTAKFVQTYLPEGFSTGEQESGRMALHLPSCLRWDYDEPYPKSFILCGDVIHYWNPGENEGHVDEIDAKREPGLDLLLVEVDELERRYQASVERKASGVAITLRPTAKNEFVAEATLELDAKLDRLVALRYVDPEG
ncbi:MAG TPA: outer membrane lipoprotein carrier protein LolA, partial [Thermoanaerobaculia bacterium]|nr:outer membrane lipoprotein carrier protein LolA [Thermoanaerobaculia bacterium]